MAYNGSEGGSIDRTTARTLMSNYKSSPAFPANNNVEGILFGKDHIHQILNQAGCEGIRIYYGKDGILPQDPPQMILVGYDVDGNDMTNKIIDMGMPCPQYCSPQGTKI